MLRPSFDEAIQDPRRRAEERKRGQGRNGHHDKQEDYDRRDGEAFNPDLDDRGDNTAVERRCAVVHGAYEISGAALQHLPVRAVKVADEEAVRRLDLLRRYEAEHPPPEEQREDCLESKHQEDGNCEVGQHGSGLRIPKSRVHPRQ